MIRLGIDLVDFQLFAEKDGEVECVLWGVGVDSELWFDVLYIYMENHPEVKTYYLRIKKW